MSLPRLITSIVGARPQFVKAAVVSRAFARRDDMRERLIHTGQHFDPEMSQVFFDELGIPAPSHDLGVRGGPHGMTTGRILEGIEALLIADRPDAVIIYGDTNSTLAGALAASKLHIPLVHVEAGLRSYRRDMPEEINRRVSDHLSDLLLAPTQRALQNLRSENLGGRANFVGDVMYDAVLHARSAMSRHSSILAQFGLQADKYALATVHRAENVDQPARLKEVLDYLSEQARSLPVVFSVHPRTQQAMETHGLSARGVTLTGPLSYFDLHRLLAECAIVFTDSGGLQKEAYFHRRPCVTLRDETEWTETVDAGWNSLWRGPDWRLPRREIADYGDGHAGDRIVEAVGGLVA